MIGDRLPMQTFVPQPWWQSSRSIWLLALLFAVPLLWPAIPPLTDVPTHMARYRVALDLGSSTHLAQYYDFRWALFGNLGVDLLVMPLARLFGLELAVKIIVIAIPSLTAAAMLLLAREAHGKIPPTSYFALPLAYAFPFQMGFLNYALGVALAFLTAALWLRMGKKGDLRLRAVLFVPVAFLVWLTHAVAWGMLGLIIFGLEYARALESGSGWWRAAVRAAISCLPLAIPALLMLEWWTMRSTGETGLWQAVAKFFGVATILRNSWLSFDLFSALLLYGLLAAGIWGKFFRFSAGLGGAALLLWGAFLVTPFVLMGAALADIRLAPYAVAVGILALRPGPRLDEKHLRFVAAAAIAFVAARIGVHTYTYWELDSEFRAEAAALDHIPRGAAVFSMANAPCIGTWHTQRVDHFASLATVRREAFTNGQWPMPGGRLLSVNYGPADGFTLSPTQLLLPDECRSDENYSLDEAMKLLPRRAFGFVWLINVDSAKWPRDPQLRQVWRNDSSVLFKVNH
jgi:hypothetical protein